MDWVVDDAEVYESIRWDLMRYATALVGPSTAEDVVSAVVTRVLARRGGLAGLREPKPYLMKSILNEVRSRHRAHSRHAALISASASPLITEPADEIIAAIDQLPPRQRAAAFLVFHEEYTPAEAAALMGTRAGTVRRYLHLARQKLREALDE